MAHKTELDAVDRKLLRQLATDGRASYQATADDVGRARLVQDPDEHADHHRARHRVREAGIHPDGAGLMAGLRGRALVAYLVVCVIWGSTYLAIRVGVGVLPPFLFAGLRFFIAGLVLLTAALALGDTLPKRLGDWRTQAIVGV